MTSVSCPFLQTVGAARGFLKKGANFAEPMALRLPFIVETRLAPDAEVRSVPERSPLPPQQGGDRGAQAGVFAPLPAATASNYASLQKLVDGATISSTVSPGEHQCAGRQGRGVQARSNVQFTAEGFHDVVLAAEPALSATTAYSILHEGVPVGKRDYMGKLRMKG